MHHAQVHLGCGVATRRFSLKPCGEFLFGACRARLLGRFNSPLTAGRQTNDRRNGDQHDASWSPQPTVESVLSHASALRLSEKAPSVANFSAPVSTEECCAHGLACIDLLHRIAIAAQLRNTLGGCH